MVKLRSLQWRAGPILVTALTGLTLLLRAWDLNAVPPYLWWDEATQGLDARALLAGQFRVFFPSAMGKEPLYIYLTTPFVAAWDGQVAAVRIAGALSGALMVPVLYYAARALWPRRPTLGVWAGVAAAGFWAANFWPQSINRIGFQVNPFPLILALAVIAWLNYTRRPTRRRAFFFGALAGLTLTTYIAARITPLLWVLLYAALPRPQRRALRPTLPWALLLAGLMIAPLALHFALYPTDFFQRMGGIAVLQVEAQQFTLDKLWLSARQLVGGFLGLYGDPIARHNIPNRPSFSPLTGALFAIGITAALVTALRRRDQAGITLLAWWFVASIGFLTSVTNAPHFPRLFGALPPALLLTAAPVGWLAARINGDVANPPAARALNRSKRGAARLALGGLLALLLAVEGIQMTRAYFIAWPAGADLYPAFQGDTWVFAQRVAQAPGAIGVAALHPGYGAQWRYAFPQTPLHQLDAGETDVEGWLAARLDQGRGQIVMTPVWLAGANLTADARGALPFYLAREGALLAEESPRGFTVLIFRLGDRPQFSATGLRGQGIGCSMPCPFPPDLTLVASRWGAAYPNLERDRGISAAGARLWAVLTWRSARPLPEARVAVDLVDAAGHRLAAAETPLLGANPRLASSWSPDATFETYHLLTVPGTQPPGEARLQVRVYDARTLAPLLAGAERILSSLAFGIATVTPPLTPLDAATLPLARPLRHTFAPGIELLGADEWPTAANAGQVVTLRFYWRLSESGTTQPVICLYLGDTAARTEIALQTGTPAGQIIHTDADLKLPADLPVGNYILRLAADGDAMVVTLGPIAIANRARQFTAPALAHPLPNGAIFGDTVQLLGLDSAPAAVGQTISIAAGQPLTLTLAWRALATPPRDLARFVHVLGADDRPVAQADDPPCAGVCPATSWLPGEVLVEQGRLMIPAGLAEGTYRLAVGWYDAGTFRRLPINGMAASGQMPTTDVVLLPVKLVVSH
jgi:hypothetical protein